SPCNNRKELAAVLKVACLGDPLSFRAVVGLVWVVDLGVAPHRVPGVVIPEPARLDHPGASCAIPRLAFIRGVVLGNARLAGGLGLGGCGTAGVLGGAIGRAAGILELG